MNIRRHRVFNFAMEAMEHSFVLEKVDVFFDILNCAADLIVTLAFLLKNVEYMSFWYH